MIKFFISTALIAFTASAATAQYAGEGGTDVAAYYTKRVAHIQLLGELYDGTVEPAMQGSGFLLDDRHVLTADHVAPDTGSRYRKVSLIVRLGSRQSKGMEAITVARDPVNDLALLQIESLTALSPHCPVSALMPPALLPMGANLFVIGYPLSRDISITPGMVSNTYDSGLLQTNAVINPGNSGGPVFSSKGYLVAIVDSSSPTATMPDKSVIDVHGLTDLTPVGRLVGSPIGAWLQKHSSSGCWRQITNLPLVDQFAWIDDQPTDALAQLGADSGFIVRPIFKGTAAVSANLGRPRDDTTPVTGTPQQTPLLGRLTVDHSLTELKDDHTLVESRIDYERVIPAAEGYLIDECGLDVVSEARARGVHCVVANDRRSATVRFELASGPVVDRWRGWLRATVSLGQQRILNLAAPVPALRSTRRLDVSQYQTAHSIAVTSRRYSRQFTATTGKQVAACAFEPTSVNHADAIGCTIDPGGSGVTLQFRLRSGPFFDRWRGWLNGKIVLSEIEPSSVPQL